MFLVWIIIQALLADRPVAPPIAETVSLPAHTGPEYFRVWKVERGRIIGGPLAAAVLPPQPLLR